MNSAARTSRLREIVMWQTYSTLRRILFAPLVAIVFYGSLAELPGIALVLGLGVFSLPILIAGVVSFDPLIWYVIALIWASDMVYLAYFKYGTTPSSTVSNVRGEC